MEWKPLVDGHAAWQTIQCQIVAVVAPETVAIVETVPATIAHFADEITPPFQTHEFRKIVFGVP